jgi:hypothetical protein
MAAGTDPRQAPIYPVLLSGGSGTRLWPLSRQCRPKQLLAFDRAAHDAAGDRLRADEESLKRLIVVGSSEHRFAIAEQLRASASRRRASSWSRLAETPRPRQPLPPGRPSSKIPRRSCCSCRRIT